MKINLIDYDIDQLYHIPFAMIFLFQANLQIELFLCYNELLSYLNFFVLQ